MNKTSDPGFGDKLTNPGRLVVVGQLYQQVPGDEGLRLDVGFSRSLLTDEQTYQRKVILQEDVETPLDSGWVDKATYLTVQHQRTHRETNPSAIEAKAESERIVVVKFKGVEVSRVRVGETAPFLSPADIKSITLIAIGGGSARCLVTVVPE